MHCTRDQYSKFKFNKVQQIQSSLDPKLFDFLSELVSNINGKDKVIATLQKEVCYLDKKVNELERYSSKDCIFIETVLYQDSATGRHDFQFL